MGTSTELLVQVLLGFSCPDTLLVVILWQPVPFPKAPIQQGCVALVRVDGRDDGAHVDRVTILAKVQAIPHE